MTTKDCAVGDAGGGHHEGVEGELVVSVLAHAMPWECACEGIIQDRQEYSGRKRIGKEAFA
jgi:hypothetical protein